MKDCLVMPIVRSLVPLLFAIAILSPAISFAGEFEGVGVNPGSTLTAAMGISDDGATVAVLDIVAGNAQGSIWTSAGGKVDIGNLGAPTANPKGVSGDGQYIVGSSVNLLGQTEAFIWSRATGVMRGLGSPGTIAYAVNTDGAVVVGSLRVGGTDRAFRWTDAGGMVNLETLSGGRFNGSTSSGVNGAGTIVVGTGTSANGGEAFRWTQATGMVGLGDLAGGGFNSWARAVSDDGSVVVGKGNSASGTEAFRWVEGVGMTGLGDLDGGAFGSDALAISSDGSVVVGYGKDASGQQAMKWTESDGMKSLKSILEDNGVDLTGWALTEARGVSADGGTIIGWGTNPGGASEGFIARTAGVLTPAQLNTSLASMSQVGITAGAMSRKNLSAMMDVSHGAILNTATGLSSGDEMNGRTQVWAVGTLISDSSFSGEDFGGEGGIGITRYLANGLSFGGGLFSGRRSLDTSFGGNQKTTLLGPGAFVAYAPEATGIRLEGGGTWHYIDMDLKRGYANGAASVQSSGSTQAHAIGLYGRIGWAFPVAESFALQPFAQYNFQRVKIDGYTESGGPFPASYDSCVDTNNRARLGLEGQYAYNKDVDLWAWAAWDHSFESRGAAMSGQLTGLYAFNYGGGTVDQNWGDAGVGAKWRPSEGFETFTRLGFGIDSQDNAEPDLALSIGFGWDI